MNLLKKQIAACLKVEELTNALKEIVKVKGQGCNAKSGRRPPARGRLASSLIMEKSKEN